MKGIGQDIDKAVEIVESCSNMDHICNTKNYIRLLQDKWGLESDSEAISYLTSLLDCKLLDISMNNKN